MRPVKAALLGLRMTARARGRATAAIVGIAVACFLLCAGRSLEGAVREATESGARDARLVVYRANRFCPPTSRLPERYVEEVARIDGVRSAVPVQVVVSNCRTSLDVVVFRGLRDRDLAVLARERLAFVDGSIEAFLARDDGALVGRGLAERRRLAVGDRLTSAGITVVVSGIVDASGMQERNGCFVKLPFLQAAAGGAQGGMVTQLEVEVADPARRAEVAASIDRRFEADAAPTSTRDEKAFAARAAGDVVRLAGFAGWLSLGALAAVFGLVASAIMLSLEGRVREVAILQAVGFGTPDVLVAIVAEGLALALAGGVVGTGAAMLALAAGDLSIGAEGVVIEFRPSASVALAAIAAAVATGVLAGLAPAAVAARRTIVEGLRCA